MRPQLRSRTACAAAWVLGLLPAIVFAQTNLPVFTLDDCLRIGVERAVAIANARRDEGIADARIRQSRAAVLPSISAHAAYTRLDKVTILDAGEEDIRMGDYDNYTASASLTQLLYSGGKAAAALKAAKLYRRYASEATALEIEAMTRRIRIGFYDVLLASAIVEVEEKSVQQLREFVRQSEQQFAVQIISEFDLLSARVRLANEIPSLIAAQNALALARSSFRNLVCLEPAAFQLAGRLALFPVDRKLADLQEHALRNRRDIVLMDTQIALIEQDVIAARGDYLPTLRAVAAYSGEKPDPFSFGQIEWGWHWNAGLTAQWILSDGGLRGGILREKTLELEKAKANRDQLARDILLEVQQAYLSMRDAAEAEAASRDNVTLAERSYAIAATRYAQGLSTYLELTDSNLALSTARLNHVRAMHAHMAAVARLSYASAIPNLASAEGENR